MKSWPITTGILVMALTAPPVAFGAPDSAGALRAEVGPTITLDAVVNGQANRVPYATTRAKTSRSKNATPADGPAIPVDIFESAGNYAVADMSFVDGVVEERRALAAATSEHVDLSWAEVEGARGYRVERDGRAIAVAPSSEYRDLEPSAGALHSYTIVPIGPDLADDAPSWGLPAIVPQSHDLESAEAAATKFAAAAAARTTSAITWRAFIPMAKVNAPSLGCPGYGAADQFGGDNRGYSTSLSAGSRSRLSLTVYWNEGARLSVATKHSPTVAYSKATGAVRARKTATVDSSKFFAKKLSLSTATNVDLRLSIYGTNPFCNTSTLRNAIAGAATINITRSGGWSIISGSHRQMPNHEILISSNGSPMKPIYQRGYLSSTCLVNLACSEASIPRTAGTH